MNSRERHNWLTKQVVKTIFFISRDNFCSSQVVEKWFLQLDFAIISHNLNTVTSGTNRLSQILSHLYFYFQHWRPTWDRRGTRKLARSRSKNTNMSVELHDSSNVKLHN